MVREGDEPDRMELRIYAEASATAVLRPSVEVASGSPVNGGLI
jgi:hypothetical protein